VFLVVKLMGVFFFNGWFLGVYPPPPPHSIYILLSLSLCLKLRALKSGKIQTLLRYSEKVHSMETSRNKPHQEAIERQ
jgi:hypothetical protein